ncbi:hypothetical protein ACQY0O_006185 [Thecaphora frezii]
MATVGDYVFLAIVLALVAGIVYALKPGQQGVNSLKQRQQALKKKGFDLSSSGLSVKSDRRAMSQQEYIVRRRLPLWLLCSSLSIHSERSQHPSLTPPPFLFFPCHLRPGQNTERPCQLCRPHLKTSRRVQVWRRRRRRRWHQLGTVLHLAARHPTRPFLFCEEELRVVAHMPLPLTTIENVLFHPPHPNPDATMNDTDRAHAAASRSPRRNARTQARCIKIPGFLPTTTQAFPSPPKR